MRLEASRRYTTIAFEPGDLERGITAAFVPDLVSVIVPCYNREKLIAQTLDTVIAQSYRPLQLVLVDDGSKDDTVGAIRRWLNGIDDPQITAKLVLRSNGGAAPARNAGLVHADGEFIHYMDSDDRIMPDKIEAQLKLMQDTGADFVWSPLIEQHVDDDGNPLPDNNPVFLYDRPDDFPDQACVGIYRRSLVCRVGFWAEDLPTREDVDYRYRMQLACRKYAYLPGARYAWLIHALGRENDKFSGRFDITSFLDCLDRAQARGGGRAIMTSIAQRYRMNADRALIEGADDLTMQGLRGSIRTSFSAKERWRARLLIVAVKGIGAAAVARLLNWQGSPLASVVAAGR